MSEHFLRDKQRVFITGYDCITSVGPDAELTYDAMRNGERGIKNERQWLEELMSNIGADAYRPILRSHLAGRVKTPTLLGDPAIAARVDEKYLEKYLSPAGALFWKVAVNAVRHAGVSTEMLDLDAVEPERIGIAHGTGIGGATEFADIHNNMINGKRVGSTSMNRGQPENPMVTLAKLLGIKGSSVSVTAACAASNYAIIEAVLRIRSGATDVMIAGGSEALDLRTIGSFEVTGAASKEEDPSLASRPLNVKPGKAVASEGAGAMILERGDFALRRGATIYGEVAGYGDSLDASDPTLSDGVGIVRAMNKALQMARIMPEDKLLASGHWTATPKGEETELDAFYKVFNDEFFHINQIEKRANSTKGFTGHPLGAANIVAAIMYTMAMNRRQFFPTPWIGKGEVMPGAERLIPGSDDLDNVDVDGFISNGMGFFGQNASIVVKQYGL